jgi:hypothetical protein
VGDYSKRLTWSDQNIFIDCTSVFDWLDSLIVPGELLLVVSDRFAIDQTLAGFIKPKHPKGERRKRKREDPSPRQNQKNQSELCSFAVPV